MGESMLCCSVLLFCLFFCSLISAVCGGVCVADEQSYTLRDAEAEVLFSFSLEESLKRAHTAPLFKVGTK